MNLQLPPYSPFTVHRSPFAVRRSPFAVLAVVLTALPLLCAAAETEPAEALPEEPGEDRLERIAEENAETLSRIPTAPLPAGSPKLDAMRERAKTLRQQHAAYVKDVATGKKLPLAHLREMRPRHIEELRKLGETANAMAAEKDPAKRKALSKVVFAALQPIGSHLEYADVGKGYVNLLSEQQQAELNKLEQAWDVADKDYDTKAKPLAFIGPGWLYTITNLSVPVTVQAPPSSTVLLQTFGGGFFSNSLPIIAVKANDAGIATADWFNYGDSVGDTTIAMRSESAPPSGELTITTVQLKLRPLPEIPTKTPSAPPLNIPEP